MKIALYDDYNKTIHKDGKIIGTVVQNFNRSAWKNGWKMIEKDMAKIYRIRKLTPKECFRLMGVSDADIEKIKSAGISESQQYKLAGNSIVVDVLEGIFTQRFRKDSDCLF